MTSSLFGLPISFTHAWIFNCYVIDAGQGLVVVDPGLPTVARQVRDLVRRDLDRPQTDIAAAMCTHGHSDHVAGVSSLTDSPLGAIHLPQRCRDYLDGEEPRLFGTVEAQLRFLPVYREQPFARSTMRDLATRGLKVGYGQRSTFAVDFEPTNFLADGDIVPEAPGWTALHTPGHTDDSTCLYHEATATLVSGDAVVTQDGRAWFNPEWVDRDDSRSTEERLRSLDVEHLLPGHGPPIAASDVWKRARSSTDKPSGNGLLARCARRFGTWPTSGSTTTPADP